MTLLTAGTLRETSQIAAQSPSLDVIGLDLELADMEGMTGFESMRAQVPSQIPIALIGPARPADEIRDMLQRGVAGYLPYSLATASMLAAWRVLAAGETYVPVEMLSAPEPAKNRIGGYLTGRERDVLNGLLAGQSNKEIAREHGLSEVTIKHHLKSLRSKLGARNRTHAVCRAVELGIAGDNMRWSKSYDSKLVTPTCYHEFMLCAQSSDSRGFQSNHQQQRDLPMLMYRQAHHAHWPQFYAKCGA